MIRDEDLIACDGGEDETEEDKEDIVVPIAPHKDKN